MNYPIMSNQSTEPKTVSTRRNAAALGAFYLLQKCAKQRSSFSLNDLQKATGWKPQTARTYVSKKWKNYLRPVVGKKSAEFSVKLDFLELDEKSFLTQFSQVLAGEIPLRPLTLGDARDQVLAALGTYADMLGGANHIASEKQVRALVDQIESI